MVVGITRDIEATWTQVYECPFDLNDCDGDNVALFGFAPLSLFF